MKLDIHTHNYRCGHAQGEIESYVRSAISEGVSFIGISDHAPLWYCQEDHPRPDMNMAKSDFIDYYREAKRVKLKYQDEIEVLIGMEIDYFPEHEEVYSDMIERFNFDFVIGAVHYFNDYHIYNPARWNQVTDAEMEVEDYLALIKSLAAWGKVDVIAHLDALKIHKEVNEWNFNSPEILKLISQNNLVLEVNSSGLRKCGEIFPNEKIMGSAAANELDFTFGSDAHSPEKVGYGYNEACKILKANRVNNLVAFKNRSKIIVSI